MKRNLIGLVVGILLLTTTLPVATSLSFQKNAENQTPFTSIDDWPMLSHDSTHTGYSTSSAPSTNTTLFTVAVKGLYALGGISISNGKAYVSSFNNHLYCFNAYNGTIIFDYTNTNWLTSVPVINNDRIYFGAYDKNIYCMNASAGSIIWSRNTSGNVYTSPALVNGKLYFGGQNNKLMCLDVNGNWLWNYTTTGLIVSSPAVEKDRVYFGSFSKKVYCLNATSGAFIWNFSTEGLVSKAVCIANNRIYAVDDNIVYCLNADTGNKIWAFPLISPQAPVVYNGKIYLGSFENKRFYCIDANSGTELWNYTVKGGIFSTSAIADGKVYFNDYGFSIYCLDAETGSLIWRYGNETYIEGAFAVYDSSLYAVGENILYAFHTNQPPETPSQPAGPTNGYLGVSYNYSTSPVTDPEGDQVNYLFDWGDNTNSGWLKEPSASHSWNASKSYDVLVKAKDTNNAESNWSEPLTVTINETPARPVLVIDTIAGLFGVSAILTNNGTVDATNITWTIALHGGFLLYGNETTGTIASLSAGENTTIKSSLIFGLGRSTITVSARCDEGVSAEKTASGFVILLFVLGVQ
jgi:outer membrane protein assembly factor BamB